MRFDADDPRITAYALGELEGAEREAVEELLEGSAEARELVEQIREMGAMLGEELGAEELGEGLTAAQRAAVVSAAVKPRRPWILRPMGAAVALAATVLLALGASMFWTVQRSSKQQRVYFLDNSSLGVDLPKAGSRTPGAEAKMGSRPAGKTGLYGLQGPTAHQPLDFTTLKPGYYSYKLDSTKGRFGPIEGQPGRGEDYSRLPENKFRLAARTPLSTFSIDVDTASYANVRRFLTRNTKPPAGAVRVEEMINYFSYGYPEPAGQHPFAVHLEVGAAPWQPRHRLVLIGLRGRQVQRKRRPASNLVFLLDVSGSMSALNKLPLLRRGMKLLVDQLTEQDRVAIVVYAGASGLVLPSTACTRENRPRILSALERLQAGGSTNGGAGIELAYQVAVANYVKGGTNRVLLATDGDFNVGLQGKGALVRLIKQKAKSGVFLSVLGFGMGNLKDATLEQLADRGNGNYAYIDNLREARKVLVEQMSGTLITIAKDVKIQVEFNPSRVKAYRLIGYENRMLAARDFNDDKKDAGEIGAGHTVTALYEVVPVGVKFAAGVDALKYQRPVAALGPGSADLLTVKLRYKEPEASRSMLLSVSTQDSGTGIGGVSGEFKFAAAVAWFGMALRGSKYAGANPYGAIIGLGRLGLGQDKNGHRVEFIKLARRAAQLK